MVGGKLSGVFRVFGSKLVDDSLWYSCHLNIDFYKNNASATNKRERIIMLMSCVRNVETNESRLSIKF